MSAYLFQILTLICIYAIVALSLNLSTGYAGLANLGQIAFFGLGAYTSAILTLDYIGRLLPPLSRPVWWRCFLGG